MCTNVIVFLQEEKETVGICTTSGGERDFTCVLLFFFRRRKTVDM